MARLSSAVSSSLSFSPPTTPRALLPLLAIAIGAVIGAPAVRADITGFGDFSDFSINQWDGAAAPTLAPGTIRLTTGTSGQSRSIFHEVPQGITQFSASFRYWSTGAPTSLFGACFVIHNASPGAQAVAAANVSGVVTRFGYSDFFGTFQRSVAVSLEHGSLASGSSSSAQYMNANASGGSISTAPVNLFTGNPIDATINYNGVQLHTLFVDSVTGASFESFSAPNIPLIVQGQAAFVGFTASTNSNTGIDQYFSNFQFSSVPAPGAAGLLGLGGVMAIGGRRRR